MAFQEFLLYITELLPENSIFTDSENLTKYGHDETENLQFPPQVVIKPRDTNEVSIILKTCNKFQIPVTPIGAQTGLSGGALCVNKGVGLSMERLNKIIEIDQKNLQITVEPAVITQVLQEEVEKLGLFYPPDPASRGTCFIGGNLAENSGGPRAVKYGVTKDWVLNLEIVLPSGEIIWTGANTLKNSTGYNLTQLMVGSEGTLGVITKAVLRLIPKPKSNFLMLVEFDSSENACKAVSSIFRAGITPSAMEFMERDALELAIDFLGESTIEIKDGIAAHLLIEVDGNYPETLMLDCEIIMETLEKHQSGEIWFADDEAQKNNLWKLRRCVGEAVKAFSIYKEEDTVVPRYELPKLLAGVKSIGDKYGFRSVCYGHAGDGNLHINILKGDPKAGGMDDDAWNNSLSKAIREIFELTVGLGGTLSGEHGIGWVQKNYMDIVFNNTQLELMKNIKSIFDPNGIMNPRKMFPDGINVM